MYSAGNILASVSPRSLSPLPMISVSTTGVQNASIAIIATMVIETRARFELGFILVPVFIMEPRSLKSAQMEHRLKDKMFIMETVKEFANFYQYLCELRCLKKT